MLISTANVEPGVPFVPLMIRLVPDNFTLTICGRAGEFGTVTMSVTLVLCVCPPLMALTVMMLVPAGVELEVEMVKIEPPEPLNDCGLKPGLAPQAGRRRS